MDAVQVRETMGKFEERLWSIIRNFIAYSRQNPAMLVNAVRIVEIQETVDKQLEASGQPHTHMHTHTLPLLSGTVDIIVNCSKHMVACLLHTSPQ